MRPSRLLALLVAACLIGAGWRVDAQTTSAIPTQPATQGPQAQAHTPKAPLAWSSLGADQQRMLAPIRNQWEQLRPARQHRLAAHAHHWATLSPARQRQIRARLTRWAAMSPAQRRQLRQNARVFHNLTPEERAKVSEAFKKFQSLPAEQRRALRQRWRAMPPNERMRWATEHPGQPMPMHPPRTSGR
ncbi:MAG: DUF3106 domain-containing protein [Rhodanobacteraceae bacterium]